MATILIWLGSGFAFGVGFCIGIWINTLTLKRRKDNDSVVQKANNLLSERNEIGREHLAAFERIASALEDKTC